MVSFSCNACQDTLKKPKLVQHFQRCYAPFTCLDCNREMWDGEFQKHTTCISEAEKYEKTLYKGDKKKGKGQQQQQQMPKLPHQEQQQQQQPAAVQVQPPKAEQPVASTSFANAVQAPGAKEAAVNGSGDASVNGNGKKKDKKRKQKEAEEPEANADPSTSTVTPATTVDAAVNGDSKATSDEQERKRRKKEKKKEKKHAKKGNENGIADGTSSQDPLTGYKEHLKSKLTGDDKSGSLTECLKGIPLEAWPDVLEILILQSGSSGTLKLSS